jgi:hypothetical protein
MNIKSAMRDNAYFFTGNCAIFSNESGIEFGILGQTAIFAAPVYAVPMTE